MAAIVPLRLPENIGSAKVSALTYTHDGNAILALTSNGVHLLWKWQGNDNSGEKWLLSSNETGMRNKIAGALKEAVPCFSLFQNDLYLMSSSGGKIHLFYVKAWMIPAISCDLMTSFPPPHPSAVTCITYCPHDYQVIAMGMDDGTICVYCYLAMEVSKLEGHLSRVTGLAYSYSDPSEVLVSTGADAQICVWSFKFSNVWEKERSKFLLFPRGRAPTSASDTRVQFHRDDTHLLIIHPAQLAIYERNQLERVNEWLLPDNHAPISNATYSCDSQLVYTSFVDDTICIFDASTLTLRYHINPSAYFPPSVRSSNNIRSLVIAAHPRVANQFAVVLSDGRIHVFDSGDSQILVEGLRILSLS
ncbi:topless-related protein 1-like [Silene latifolia]|uniref:topless-related protein 1-like n=1 Tax=Silene latifolia TaxID=37657 RepID=UPI003D7707A2